MEPRLEITPPREPATSPSRALLLVALEQAWGLCLAYLGVGLLAEILRRGGLRFGESLQRFLDGLPHHVLLRLRLLDSYLSAVSIGAISPFWNRLLLCAITVSVILLLATVTGFVLAGVTRLFDRKPRP